MTGQPPLPYWQLALQLHDTRAHTHTHAHFIPGFEALPATLPQAILASRSSTASPAAAAGPPLMPRTQGPHTSISPGASASTHGPAPTLWWHRRWRGARQVCVGINSREGGAPQWLRDPITVCVGLHTRKCYYWCGVPCDCMGMQGACACAGPGWLAKEEGGTLAPSFIQPLFSLYLPPYPSPNHSSHNL